MTGSARLAAWIAILAAGGLLVALVVLAVVDALALAVAVVLLLVAAAAAWVALTRAGVLRVVGAAVAAAALIGTAAALIAFDAVDELAAVAAGAALFAGASRVALRASAAPTQLEVRRPAQHAVLLMNPKSGGGKVERFDLAAEARRRGVEPIVLAPGDDLRALAREAARSADVIGMAGGDGSQALVAEVALEHDIGFVCVPAGTRNHLALDLGLDRDDVVGALDAYSDGVEERIDVAFVNDRIFVNNVSLGVYAEIVQSDAYRGAKLATIERMLPELIGPDARPFDLRFDGPNGDGERTAQLLLVSNNPYLLDRIGALGSRPRLDTGQLGVLAVEVTSAVEASELVALQAAGQVRRFSGWQEWSTAAFEVASSGPIAAGIDGEAARLDPPLRFRIAPGALRLRRPARAIGVSPAGLDTPFTRDGVRRLWRIAVAQP